MHLSTVLSVEIFFLPGKISADRYDDADAGSRVLPAGKLKPMATSSYNAFFGL